MSRDDAQVCQLTRRIPYALMQWAAIATPTAEAEVATASSGLWGRGDEPDDDLTQFADLPNSSS